MNTRYIEKELSLKELNTFFHSNSYEIEIDTPDGWQPLLGVTESGELDCLIIKTKDDHLLECSEDHLVETLFGMTKASDLKVGDPLVTRFALSEVVSIEKGEKHECLDVAVGHEKHRIWANNISTHNCYGGSAWTVSRNMGETPDEAQEKIDAFFQELPDLLAYMYRAKRSALETGFVKNLFGRLRSVVADIQQGRKGIGYAERTALNHPIQSTAGDLLKISTIRISDLIERKKWSPTWGDRIPMIQPEGTSYKDFIFCMFSSVHDELVSIIKDGEIENFSPLVYEAMQIEDVIRNFGVRYNLEMDSEYDLTRSWTSTEKYDQAKIYMLRHLLKAKTSEGQLVLNGYSIPFDKITRNLLEFINTWTEEVEEDAEVFALVSTVSQKLYVHDRRFSQNLFDALAKNFSVPLVGVHVPV